MAGDDQALHTTNTANNSEMKKEVEEWTVHRLAMVHNVLVMWQGSQNLSATEKKSRTRNM